MFRWLSRLFRLGRHAEAAQGHMTFGATSLGRSMARTRLLLKKQLWIWPILSIIALALIGFGVSRSIRYTMEQNLRTQLQTLLNVERAMLQQWLAVQEANAQAMANDLQVRQTVDRLLAAEHATSPGERAPETAKLIEELGQELGAGMSSHKFTGYFLADTQQRVVAASSPETIGQIVPEHEAFLTRALDGQTTVSSPYRSVAILKDEHGRLRTGVPTMFACAPVRDEHFQVVAVLALRIRPEREFTQALQKGRFGETGETYAIDKQGVMVSNSRFDEQLIMLGLLPDEEQSTSLLTLHVRNPGVSLVDGQRPTVRRAELPLTRPAAAAISGTDGIDLAGYRDYRGQRSVGAWTWLPKYELGLISEIDFAEAFGPLTILRRTFYALFALLGAGSLAIFVFTIILSRMQREAQKAAIEAKQLGQYRLEEQIGSGAMGVVYKGHHAMLRRPTAIKMLDVERVNESSIARFEREVQITCQLNNPNTVAIYDYGRTPEGVFYYAMEYLDGIDLQALVDRYGPQPEGRIVNILKQVCGSLYEAHSLGLVHRDIKPANLMLTRRGYVPDVIKVLDFGLVKAMGEDRPRGASSQMSGTPLYMSPEAIQSPDLVDARSDLYAVGAVGYFLLTGRAVFSAQSLAELCQHHIDSQPQSPSQVLGRPVSPELEHALLACLDKSRAKRPQTARDLAAMLDRVTTQPWSIDDAEGWWSRHERNQPAATGPAPASAAAPSTAPGGSTHSAGLDQTMIHNAPRDDE